MKLPRRKFLHLAAGAAALPSVSRIARAQDRPSKPVRIIVGFTAGSATDITARLFAQKLNEAWKTSVTVENIPGAGGSVGAERVAKSAPDGSTLYWGANGAMTINPSLQPSPTFDPARDLAPIARVLVMPSILAVNNEVPAKSVAELFALAKAQPGKLTRPSPGSGCWRQPARWLPSSARCMQTSCRSRRKPTCASGWRSSVLRRPSIRRRSLLWLSRRIPPSGRR